MDHRADTNLGVGGGLTALASAHLGDFKAPSFRYRVECRDAAGTVRWIEEVENIVVTVGKTDMVAKYFSGAAYTAAWYLGLTDGAVTPTYAVADTMAAHAGWTENVGYSNATRPTWVPGAAAAGSIDNTGTPAVFTINAGGTIAGAFMTTSNAKSGTAGTLYGEANFSASRVVLSGDTLNVTSCASVS